MLGPLVPVHSCLMAGDETVPETQNSIIVRCSSIPQKGWAKEDERQQIKEEDILWCCIYLHTSLCLGDYKGQDRWFQYNSGDPWWSLDKQADTDNDSRSALLDVTNG